MDEASDCAAAFPATGGVAEAVAAATAGVADFAAVASPALIAWMIPSSVARKPVSPLAATAAPWPEAPATLPDVDAWTDATAAMVKLLRRRGP
jgi:hypothetical protein